MAKIERNILYGDWYQMEYGKLISMTYMMTILKTMNLFLYFTPQLFKVQFVLVLMTHCSYMFAMCT